MRRFFNHMNTILKKKLYNRRNYIRNTLTNVKQIAGLYRSKLECKQSNTRKFLKEHMLRAEESQDIVQKIQNMRRESCSATNVSQISTSKPYRYNFFL